MPRYTYLQNAFTAGQISPKLDGRSDVKEYSQGVKELTSLIPYKSGGISRCPGLIKRQSFDTAFFPDGDAIGNYSHITSDRDSFDITFQLINGNANKLQIRSVETGATLVIGGALAALDVELDPITGAKDFSHTQVNNVSVFCHKSGDVKPFIIWQRQDLTFRVEFVDDTSAYDPQLDPPEVSEFGTAFLIPVRDANTTPITMTPSAVPTIGASINITASVSYFTSGHVGTVVVLDPEQSPPGGTQFTNAVVYAIRITAFNSAFNVTGTVVIATQGVTISASATDYWYEGAWSDRRGWPKLCSFYQNRLIFANNRTQPNTIWASEIGRFGKFNRFFVDQNFTNDEFATNILPDGYTRAPSFAAGPFESSISSTEAANITWISSTRNLLLGTLEGEYVVTTNQTFLSATSIGFVKQSSYGSLIQEAKEADENTYFISRDGSGIIELGYSNENGGFVARDISLVAEGILDNDKNRREKYTEIVWDSIFRILWAITDRNELIGVSLSSSLGTRAFFRRPVDGKIIDILPPVTVPSNTFQDEYTVNTRIVVDKPVYNALGGIMILEFGDFFEFNFESTDTDLLQFPDVIVSPGPKNNFPFYTDFAETVPVGGTVWPTGFTDGSVLSALADDGTVYEGLVVESGNVTTSESHSTLIVGVPYISRVVTNRIEVGPNQITNSQGDISRIDRATLILYKTYTGSYGSEDTDLYDLEDIDKVQGFTGRVSLDLPQSPEVENRVVIQTSSPLPLNVLGLVMRGVNNS